MSMLMMSGGPTRGQETEEKEIEKGSEADSKKAIAKDNIDKMREFRAKIQEDLIGDYTHWEVFVDIKQYYLGRVFIWAKREEALDLSTLSSEEWAESKAIIDDLRNMHEKLYQPDMINYASLGNDVGHCHWHVVPRYQTPRTIGEITFKDENWGENYSRPNTKKFKIPKEVHQRIRAELKDALAEVRAKEKPTERKHNSKM